MTTTDEARLTDEELDDVVRAAREYVGTPDAFDTDEVIVALADRLSARDAELAKLRKVAEAAKQLRDDEDGDQWNCQQRLFVALKDVTP